MCRIKSNLWVYLGGPHSFSSPSGPRPIAVLDLHPANISEQLFKCQVVGLEL